MLSAPALPLREPQREKLPLAQHLVSAALHHMSGECLHNVEALCLWDMTVPPAS